MVSTKAPVAGRRWLPVPVGGYGRLRKAWEYGAMDDTVNMNHPRTGTGRDGTKAPRL